MSADGGVEPGEGLGVHEGEGERREAGGQHEVLDGLEQVLRHLLRVRRRHDHRPQHVERRRQERRPVHRQLVPGVFNVSVTEW